MAGHTRERTYFLFLNNPIQLYTINKVVGFVASVGTLLKLAETGATRQAWSPRHTGMKQ